MIRPRNVTPNPPGRSETDSLGLARQLNQPEAGNHRVRGGDRFLALSDTGIRMPTRRQVVISGRPSADRLLCRWTCHSRIIKSERDAGNAPPQGTIDKKDIGATTLISVPRGGTHHASCHGADREARKNQFRPRANPLHQVGRRHPRGAHGRRAGIKFGLAFCEASGKCLVRWSGTDDSMVELARKNAVAIAAGHSFILFLDEGFYPLNVLNTLKMVPEVCRIFCATANPTEVIVPRPT